MPGTHESTAESHSERTRFVLYDPDSDSLLTTQVFDSADEAAEWASPAEDILILPIRVTVCSA